MCLKHLPAFSATSDHYFHDDNVPWQRVINAKGIISPRYTRFKASKKVLLATNQAPEALAVLSDRRLYYAERES